VEIFAIIGGIFLLLIGGSMLYRKFFDRERWDKAVADGRAAGRASKAKSELKLQAMKERDAQKAADRKAQFELKLQAMKERDAQKTADGKKHVEAIKQRFDAEKGGKKEMSKNPLPGESVGDYVARRMADKQGNKHLKILIASHLIADEEVLSWAPAIRIGEISEGVAALTSRRVIFFKSGTFGDKLEPIPIDKVSSVESERGMLVLDATIHTSNDSLKLRFTDKPRGDELLLALQEILHKPAAAAVSTATAPTLAQKAVDDPMAQIVKLGELRDAGVLTEAEFSAKKAELLSRI
jgi:hypothetical protein